MKFSLVVMGCQMNQYDAARIREHLLAAGLSEASPQESDLAVVLTCVVRKKPQDKAMSVIKGLLSQGKRVVAAGCLPGVAEHDIRALGAEVLGAGEYHRIPSLLGLDVKSPARSLAPGEFSGFITIAEGCDNFCTYCIVPYVRGPERSRPPGEILAEARQMEAQGLRDLTLLGQNVNSYSWEGTDFPGLLALIHDETKIPFVKFTTSHPKDIKGSLVEVIKHRPRLSRWFHMPLQSGSDRILALMNRRYTSEEYLRKVDMIRKALPGAVITTDLMVGFPGETEEDFSATLRMVERVGFDRCFMFAFNERPGTPAADMPDQVPREIRSRRLRELIDLSMEVIKKRRQRFLGEVMDVLSLGPGKSPGTTDGVCREGLRVILRAKVEPGRILRARIDGLEGLLLMGKPLLDPAP